MKIRAIMAVTLIISMCVFADNIDASSAGVSEKHTAASVNEQMTDDGTTGDLFSFLDDNNDGDEVSATTRQVSPSQFMTSMTISRLASL